MAERSSVGDAVKLRQLALRHLARREHSRLELARKLVGQADGAAIDAVLDELQREGLLSNLRYAESLARSRAGRHGSLRVKADLAARGVSAAEAAEVVATAREQDFEAARSVWLKKFGAPARDAGERARQMRFLSSRGFPTEVIRRVVGGSDD